jgi:hypothetical protein
MSPIMHLGTSVPRDYFVAFFSCSKSARRRLSPVVSINSIEARQCRAGLALAGVATESPFLLRQLMLQPTMDTVGDYVGLVSLLLTLRTWARSRTALRFEVRLPMSTTNRDTSGVQITPRNALKRDQIDFLAVGDPTHIAQVATGHRLSASESQRRVALQ